MAFGPLLKQVLAQAAKNPHVQKAMKSAAAQAVNHPQVRQGFQSARASFRKGLDAVTGRNKPPSAAGAKTQGNSRKEESGGFSGGGGGAFENMRAFWGKHKTGIASFIAANFMGIILLLQVGSGIWPVLKAALMGHGHSHEYQRKKQLKDKQAQEVSEGGQAASDLGQTHFSDKEDGMTFYNVTDAETVNTTANPVQSRREVKNKRRQREQLNLQEEQRSVSSDSFDGQNATSVYDSPDVSRPSVASPDDAPLSSASAEEIFAFSKANSGAVSSFDNSFHYKLGDEDGYQSSVESEGVAGRDARESAKNKRNKSMWLSMFRRSEDPLVRSRSLQSNSGEETLVFDMRSVKDH
jgi:hypothetical protein